MTFSWKIVTSYRVIGVLKAILGPLEVVAVALAARGLCHRASYHPNGYWPTHFRVFASEWGRGS
jgi:hypothetical protein